MSKISTQIALILALASISANFAQAGKASCLLRTYSEVLGEIKRNNSITEYLSDWRDSPLTHLELDSWLNSILGLTTASRQKIIKHLREHPLKDSESPSLLKLALYAETEWKNYWKNLNGLPGRQQG